MKELSILRRVRQDGKWLRPESSIGLEILSQQPFDVIH